jgi:hypothetical protein
MPIFGGIGRALTKPGENSGLSIADRLAIFGTAYNGDYDTAMAIRNAPAQRAQMAQRDAFGRQLAGMLGPQYAETQGAGAAIQAPSMPGMPQAEAAPEYQYQAPQRISDGLNINSPELGALTMQAKDVGYDMSDLLGVLKAQEPKAPRQIEGPDGVYEQQGGQWKKVLAYPDKPEKPELLTTDRLMAGVVQKMTTGVKLTPTEERIANRFFNGIPKVGGGGRGGSAKRTAQDMSDAELMAIAGAK